MTLHPSDTQRLLGTRLSASDYRMVRGLTAGRDCDLIITADTQEPYIMRWHMTPRLDTGNCYLHVQLSDDQDRGPHDHPWDNTSFVLSGGYREFDGDGQSMLILPGDTKPRKATDLHRLELLCDYSVGLFWTGPKVREWGFQLADGWAHHEQVVTRENGLSRWREKDVGDLHAPILRGLQES